MKKFFSIALAVLFAGNAMALDNVPESGFSMVAFGGMTVSNLKDSGMNPKVGVTFGVKVDYVLPNAYGTYVSAGIDWVDKGARKTGDWGAPVGNVTQKMLSHYLEIPLHVGYRYNFSDKLGVYGEIGPYFALGITGKNKINYEDDLIPDESAQFFGKHFGGLIDDDLDNIRAIQRFDCGFGFRIGAEYNQQYSLTIGYDWGFTDMYTDKFRTAFKTFSGGISLSKMKNHNLSITFGYRF